MLILSTNYLKVVLTTIVPSVWLFSSHPDLNPPTPPNPACKHWLLIFRTSCKTKQTLEKEDFYSLRSAELNVIIFISANLIF